MGGGLHTGGPMRRGGGLNRGGGVPQGLNMQRSRGLQSGGVVTASLNCILGMKWHAVPLLSSACALQPFPLGGVGKR